MTQVDDSVGWILCHGIQSSEACAYSRYSGPHGNVRIAKETLFILEKKKGNLW